MKLASMKGKRISFVSLVVILAFALASGLNGCKGCEEDARISTDIPAANTEEIKKVTFSGDIPYTGWGLLNDAELRIYVDNTAAAHNSQIIDEGSKTGKQEYSFAGNYDPDTYELTGTITITRNDRLGGEGGTGMTLRYTGTLSAKRTEPNEDFSDFMGTATGTQVWSYDRDVYDDAGKVKFKADEQQTKNLNWNFLATNPDAPGS